ncbi:MAG: response regulator [Zetaproteobacteria bacterium]|nr:MAG: response regulator [Zetaproteobacteria bacterium]
MTRQPTILIADEDEAWVRSMASLLAGEGYRVLSARTGVDALYQARMRGPDLILLNPELRQLSGWEVCRRLTQSPAADGAKVVMLTIRGEAAYRAGADGYLVKAGQVEPTLPPVRVFRHPAQGILTEFLHRRAVAA